MQYQRIIFDLIIWEYVFINRYTEHCYKLNKQLQTWLLSLIFNRLKMHETQQRNGVLIYLAIHNRKFAILGDEGINKVVEENFWNDVKDLMLSHFKEGRFAEGLEQGIQRCGEKLKTYFPYQSDDVNEIPDEISYEDN